MKKIVFGICIVLLFLNFTTALSTNEEGRVGINFIKDAVTNFLSLTDSPSTYSGDGGTCIKVNGAEDGIEFGSCVVGDASTDLYVNETGDTMTGDLNMSNNSLLDVDTIYVHNITGRSPIVFGSNINLSSFNITGFDAIIGSGKYLTDIDTTGFGRIGAFPYLYNDTLSIYLNSTSLNETIDQKLATTTYTPTEIWVDPLSSATYTYGDVGNVSSMFDIHNYTVEEGAGSEPLTIRVNFTEVVSFNNGITRVWYDGGSGHIIDICLWNYVSSAWECAWDLTYTEDYEIITGSVFGSENYVGTGDDAGVVQMKYDHEGTGSTQHTIYIDYVALTQGVSAVTSNKHDALSGRTHIDNHPQYLTTDASREVDGSFNITGNLSVSDNIYVNEDGDIRDSFVYFSEGGDPEGRYIAWDEPDGNDFGSLGENQMETIDLAVSGTLDVSTYGSYGFWVTALEFRPEGNAYINYDGGNIDSFLYFYSNGIPTGQSIAWDDTALSDKGALGENQFEILNNTGISGDLIITKSLNVTEDINVGRFLYSNDNSLVLYPNKDDASVGLNLSQVMTQLTLKGQGASLIIIDNPTNIEGDLAVNGDLNVTENISSLYQYIEETLEIGGKDSVQNRSAIYLGKVFKRIDKNQHSIFVNSLFSPQANTSIDYSGVGGYAVINGSDNYDAGTIVKGLDFGTYGYGSGQSGNQDNVTLYGIYAFGSGQFTGTVNVSSVTGLFVTPWRDGFGGQIQTDNAYGVYIDQAYQFFGKTHITDQVMLYVDKPTRGDSDYQVVLEGYDAGSGIWFGSRSSARIYGDTSTQIRTDASVFYADGTVSAETIVDRSEEYNKREFGSAVDYLSDVETRITYDLSDKPIYNHEADPLFIQEPYNYSCNCQTVQKCHKELAEKKTSIIDSTQVIIDVCEEVEQCDICESTARDIGSSISWLRQVNYELLERIETLETENELIKSELCKKDPTYRFCLGIES